uniref:Uncharacterized protein n=1 Tax=Heterorhabditis bacteriophora TaxID=37862 RepID=A0A1I7WU18_HETBA
MASVFIMKILPIIIITGKFQACPAIKVKCIEILNLHLYLLII